MSVAPPTKDDSLYNQVIDITVEYMGPTANRFITRQIHTHLNKNPKELTAKDINILTDWIKIEISLLTDDSKVIEAFTEQLLHLAKKDK